MSDTENTKNGEGTQSRLEELRAAKVLREKAAREQAEKLEVEELELEEKLTQEFGSRDERNFEIISTPWGVFGVRRPDARGIQAFNRLKEDQSGKKPLSIDEFAQRLRSILQNYVVPAEKKTLFLSLAGDRPAVVDRAGQAFMYLMGNEVVDSSRKF